MNTTRVCLAALLFCFASLSGSPLFAQATSKAPQVVRLDASMSAASEAALTAEGITILHYYGEQTYLLSGLPSTVKAAVVELSSQKAVQARDINASSDVSLDVDLVLAFPDAKDVLRQVLAKAEFNASELQVKGGLTLSGSVSAYQLGMLLENPLILDATPVMDDFIPYNIESRIAQSVTPLNSNIAGAPDLNGQGVVLGIGDGGQLSGHPDIGDRVVHSTTYYNSAWGNHPDMVAGIMAGTGSIFNEYQGVACEAELIIEPSSAIVYWAPDYLNQYQMSITNNSYGPSFHCNTANKYYGQCASVDQQLFDNPNLLHIYAVGNSGTSSCNGMPVGYSNIPGGGQVAKNSLSVGNVKFDRTRFRGSSAGPTFDGRIKPEIMALGRSVVSNNRNGGYSTGTGTSYAAPGVAATLGLLTQRFKELHGGVLPDGALLKAIACNTAEDIGPAGPDYQNGFGLINGVRALSALENSNYHQSYLSQGAQFSSSVSATSMTERLKVLLYWSDQAGSTTNTVSTLVNDFDLKVVAPNGDTIRPWVLNPYSPTASAIQGTDTLNNIEQVTIDSPLPGAYQILVDGIVLPYGSTDFVVSWVIQEPEVLLTCPYGGESLTPFEDMYISWDASPGQTGTWKVEHSLDGTVWQTIQSGISAEVRHIVWAPQEENTEVQLRITNETTLLSDQTNEPAFVLGKPENVVGEPMCDGGITLRWSPVNTATSYQVYKYDGSEMALAGTVADTFVTLNGLEVGVDSLFTVAAISSSGNTSQRAFAVTKKSEIGGSNCYSPLPVEWVSVAVQQVEDDVEVQWTVASENNNERFELLRSTSMVEPLDWTIIARVEGRGTDLSAKTYRVMDNAAAEGSTIYYQIKQVDFDGSSELSEIVALTYVSATSAVSSTLSLVENPVNNFIEIISTSSSETEVNLYDLSGRVKETFQLHTGLNSIPWPSGLHSGVYVLRANSAQGVESLKLVKR